MANPLDPMDLKQIISLHLNGLSNRAIERTLGIHRNTINAYIQRFKTCEHKMEKLLDFDEGKLRELFTIKTTIDNKRYNELMLYLEEVKESRKHPGFTFLFHYQEYVQKAENPYSYTQFMEHYNRRYKKVTGSMKLEHVAGRELFIDFAGKKLHITDRETGELIAVEVFVAILPYSQYTYVEACMSQKRGDLLVCMRNALSFYGGVPKAIVSDNLKSAVSRSCKYEPEINRSFKDFACHHGCAVNPTRTYSPQDKALVENAVNLSYQRIYYPMREMTFFSLQELNQEIRRRLEHYNSLLFQRKEASRKELFQSVERSLLSPLPVRPYEIKEYRRAKVQKMSYVYFSPDQTYYSVPYRFIGKQVQIHYTEKVVEVYFNHERIAIHTRQKRKGIYITQKQHLSSSHQKYLDWSPEYFQKKAARHGSFVECYVKGLIASCQYPEIGYKRAMGIIQLYKKYSSERLNKACQRALLGETYSYKHVLNILENKLDMEVDPQLLPQDTPSHIPAHENIRGAQAYQ